MASTACFLINPSQSGAAQHADITDKINADLNEALLQPEVRGLLRKPSVEIPGSSICTRKSIDGPR